MNPERLRFCLEMRRKYPETPRIHPSVEIPEWVILGKNVSIHANVTLGTQGFGFEWSEEEGQFLHIPHIGRVVIEDDVEIFEGSYIERGTINDTAIGRGTKIDAMCIIGHNTVIGPNCILTANCVIGGSVVIGSEVYIGLNATIRNKAKIADRVFIGQGANVVCDINQAGGVWTGNPAKFIRWRSNAD